VWVLKKSLFANRGAEKLFFAKQVVSEIYFPENPFISLMSYFYFLDRSSFKDCA
jgi:hypothetical protein